MAKRPGFDDPDRSEHPLDELAWRGLDAISQTHQQAPKMPIREAVTAKQALVQAQYREGLRQA